MTFSDLYAYAKQLFLTGQLDWTDTVNPIKVALIDLTEYNFDLANDQFLSDIPQSAIVATAEITNRTATNGVADGDQTTFQAVTGPQCGALVIYQDTGDEATSPLILFLHQDDVPGLPVIPNGGDITVVWSTSANRIFSL